MGTQILSNGNLLECGIKYDILKILQDIVYSKQNVILRSHGISLPMNIKKIVGSVKVHCMVNFS